jgi:hypothetical protein
MYINKFKFDISPCITYYVQYPTMETKTSTEHDATLVFKKLQILYTYSQHRSVDKSFNTLLKEASIWDDDCKYALSHTQELDIKKLL